MFYWDVFLFYSKLQCVQFHGGEKKDLCMPQIDCETCTLVLLSSCSNISSPRSQPCNNGGHKNKRTKHTLHSGGISDSAAMCLCLYIYICALAHMHLCYHQLCFEARISLVPLDWNGLPCRRCSPPEGSLRSLLGSLDLTF